jgi:Enoyl-(Acyl carrier protein) reductase
MTQAASTLCSRTPAAEMLPLEAITAEHVDRIFGTNVKGLLFTVQKALPLMTDGGCPILTGSTAGRKSTARFSVYSASKAAVRSLARSWVLELAPHRIRVNVVSPGPIATPWSRGPRPAGSQEHALPAARQRRPWAVLATRRRWRRPSRSSPLRTRASSTGPSSLWTGASPKSDGEDDDHRTLDRARDAVDLVAATVDAPGLVEQAIFREISSMAARRRAASCSPRRRQDCGSAESRYWRPWLTDSPLPPSRGGCTPDSCEAQCACWFRSRAASARRHDPPRPNP